MEQFFTIIGISDEQTPVLSAMAAAAVASSRVFSGGRRHYEAVKDLLPPSSEWIEISVPLDKVFEQYAAHHRIVVFASGDPLFYGFAATIQHRLPTAKMEIIPAPNSIQMLAHRLAMPYGDMRMVSVTGRPWQELDRALIEGCTKIGVLTDHVRTPAAVASRLLEYGYTGYRMAVGERLGSETMERVTETDLKTALHTEFAAPNCLILHGRPIRPPFGIDDNLFDVPDGRVNMITKMPVRLTTLAMLDLTARNSFWDIGFCTGSVSIEARLRFPHLRITAFEKCHERGHLMEINSRRFHAPGIEWHIGDFLSADMDRLPIPDSVFIGGHGGQLAEIVAAVGRVLLPSGTIVFNSVSGQSREAFLKAVSDCGIQVASTVTVRAGEHNPIYIIKAIKI